MRQFIALSFIPQRVAKTLDTEVYNKTKSLEINR